MSIKIEMNLGASKNCVIEFFKVVSVMNNYHITKQI
jgi:hypothetical protein